MTLVEYYKHHFPVETVVRMLEGLGPLDCMEIAIRGRTSNGKDFFRRYNSATDATTLRDLVGRPEIREVHFGGFFEQRVSREYCSEHPAVKKPLVIDVDLQDFGPVQRIGIQKEDLAKCDAFLSLVLLGIEVLKVALEDAFGFKKFACFYSGRRGAHIWVLDERAFGLSSEARSAIVDSLTATRGSIPLHSFPPYSRAVDRLMSGFGNLALLDDDAYASSFVKRMKIKKLSFCDFENEVIGREGAFERWAHIQKRIKAGDVWMQDMLRNLVVQDTWPPIDAAVSASAGHLTKAPFSVHASTGRIAVALPTNAVEFDPASCPSLQNLKGLQRSCAKVSVTSNFVDQW